MPFATPPPYAAWQHRDARDGFEVVFLRERDGGYRVEGHTTAVEDGEVFTVEYLIDVDANWRTRRAAVAGHSSEGRYDLTVEGDGEGSWQIDGAAAPALDGCFDLDLESSSFTNALPVHRLGLEVGQGADAPAAYVRAVDLSVERLEQRYVRTSDDGHSQRFDYASPAFGFECTLVYDGYGLVTDYPGIARRIA